jgi:hypothetical protein
MQKKNTCLEFCSGCGKDMKFDITEMVDQNKKSEPEKDESSLASSKLDKLLKYDSKDESTGEEVFSNIALVSKPVQSFVSNVRILSCIHCIHESCHEEYKTKKYKNY